MVRRARLPIAAGLLPLILGGCGADGGQRVQAHREQQARALVAEYERARAQQDLLGMCVKSNQVAAAYTDAHAPGDAAAWRSKNAEDCRAAKAALVPDLAARSGTDR